MPPATNEAALIDDTDLQEDQYTDLQKKIDELKDFAKPLQKESLATPLMGVISRIMSLSLKSRDRISEVIQEVEECTALLNELSWKYVEQILAPARQSNVFRVVNNSNLFAETLKEAIGTTVEDDDGTKVEITQELVNLLTRFKFSIGTPPITEKGIQTLEKIMFNEGLKDIYGFRNILGTKIDVFDRFLKVVGNMVEQSTHYTTAGEKEDYENLGRDFTNKEGMRGFSKTVISGSATTAVRLIKKHLFKHHMNGSTPLRVIENCNLEDPAKRQQLIADMKSEKGRSDMFVVKVSKMPHTIFSDNLLKGEWEGVIGRLIIVEEDDNSNRSASTLVYSFNPRVTSELSKYHIKDSGTVANTQLNLRRILEGFSPKQMTDLKVCVEDKLKYYSQKPSQLAAPGEARKKEWVVSDQKAHASLAKFHEFLSFIEKIQNANQEELDDINLDLIGDVEELTRQYFFKDLDKNKYKTIGVPQGGGRYELGLIGDYHLARHKQNLSDFRENNLGEANAKLAILKQQYGIKETSSTAETAALGRAQDSMKSPSQAVRDLETTEIGKINGLREYVNQKVHKGLTNAEDLIDDVLRKFLDNILGTNIPGILKSAVSKLLSSKNLKAAAKNLERGGFRDAANRLRSIEGFVHRVVEEGVMGPAEKLAGKGRRAFEKKTLEHVEAMLKNIEKKGAFNPGLVLAEMGWSFNDVMTEENYPTQDYLRIEIDQEGNLKLETLEQKLKTLKENLSEFPELFDLYCKSILLIFNDPHNPTGRIASPQTKLKLLDIASEYGLSIVADEAYLKMITEELKDRDGDLPFATFYDQNKARFRNPVKIYGSLPVTKWAFGGGRRTGSIVTNDVEKHQIIGEDGKAQELTFEQYVRTNVDGVNNMSLYMDRDILRTGLKAKAACKVLEEAMARPWQNPAEAIDKFLEKEFEREGGIGGEDFNGPVYFALMEGRNDLDRLRIREASVGTREEYINGLISKIKELRLDKQTRKDTERRIVAGKDAVERVAKDFPGLKEKYIEPQGPFYLCVRLDETETGETIQKFAEALAAARKTDGISVGSGYVRFSFGGYLDGSDDGYKMLSLAFETDLRILLKYWAKFKEEKERLISKGESNVDELAIDAVFPGLKNKKLMGRELARAKKEKDPLIKALKSYKEKGRSPLVFPISSDASKYVSKIEPSSKAEVVLIKGASCENMEDFISSRAFHNLFNYYLLKIKNKVPALKGLDDNQILGGYGASKFREKAVVSRTFKDGEKDTFAAIATEIAKIYFSDETIKILAESKKAGGEDLDANYILGVEKRTSDYIEQFLRVFLTAEQEVRLKLETSLKPKDYEKIPAEGISALSPEVLRFKPNFQVGYESVKGVTVDPNSPDWLKGLIEGDGEEKEGADFATKTIPTDQAPRITTEAMTRLPGYRYGIFRRDGDGEDLPAPQEYSDRLKEFIKTANPKDYVCKMVQVGHMKSLLVMHKSFAPYMIEELRLLPQFDVPLREINNIKPDAVSFMGIPSKVMGDDYKIGYFYDKNKDGSTLPVSWASGENTSDYVGFFKKPLLTLHNEKTKERGGLPIHGSAMTIVFKNGLRKTIVVAGDSGTGKSETMIAMRQQIVREIENGQEVEAVEMISGDMLSLFEGEDGQLYMLGTEEGDFMRTTDIPSDYMDGNRDMLGQASFSNMSHPKNPRATLPHLCDRNTFLKPLRVNHFLVANNYQKPSGSAVEEVPSQENLLMDVYVRGVRIEKGTSGDQPSLFYSLKESKVGNRDEIIATYGEDLDKLLGWNITVGKDGKVSSSVLSFRDVPNKKDTSVSMAKEMFEGKECFEKRTIKEDGKDKEVVLRWRIKEVKYDAIKNNFTVVKESLDENGKVEESPLNRPVFDGIYAPHVATYCGNPFVDPKGMDEVLRHMAEVMKKSGVITGIIRTQLGVSGSEVTGPSKASSDLIEFLTSDPRVNERFKHNKDKVHSKLIGQYGPMIFGQTELPEPLKAYNLKLLERHESDTLKLVRVKRDSEGKVMLDEKGEAIKEEIPDIHTPLYRFNPEAANKEFVPSLLTPEMFGAIDEVMNSGNYQQISIEGIDPTLSEYPMLTPAMLYEVYDIIHSGSHNGLPREKLNETLNQKGFVINQEMFEKIYKLAQSKKYEDLTMESIEKALSKHAFIRTANNREELIFQILMKNGISKLESRPEKIAEAPYEVKKAALIADMLLERRPDIVREAA